MCADIQPIIKRTASILPSAHAGAGMSSTVINLLSDCFHVSLPDRQPTSERSQTGYKTGHILRSVKKLGTTLLWVKLTHTGLLMQFCQKSTL